ncbi:hypothetical protein KQI72_09800 [Eubacterium sp. MSJ-21]|nr:hypothetical protein [Eubacterium sp. MSJ-21]
MRKKIVSSIIVGAMLIGNITAYAQEPSEAGLATDTDASIAVEVPVERNQDTDTTTESGIDAAQTETLTGDADVQEDGIEVQAKFDEINQESVFLKQAESGTCTLVANVNMLRRNALIHGDTAWQDITVDAARPELWIDGTGMKWDYQYGDTAVNRYSLEEMTGEEKVALFQDLLKRHPEGIVIHQWTTSAGYPHAVLLTDYSDGVFYCVDPSNANAGGLSGKRTTISDTVVTVENADQYWCVAEPGQLEDGVLYANPGGILPTKADHTGYSAGVVVNTMVPKSRIDFSWYASKDGGDTYTCISDWTTGYEWIDWTPDVFGQYMIKAETRVDGNDDSIQEVYIDFSYSPLIKGKCQMPYTGQGGGFLIGVETYDNPDQKYMYEMQILDCTLLAQDQPAWIYTTGKCYVDQGTSFWTVWQPVYGYYWTLFRVYDENGTLVDEQCYGFENICK